MTATVRSRTLGPSSSEKRTDHSSPWLNMHAAHSANNLGESGGIQRVMSHASTSQQSTF